MTRDTNRASKTSTDDSYAKITNWARETAIHTAGSTQSRAENPRKAKTPKYRGSDGFGQSPSMKSEGYFQNRIDASVVQKTFNERLISESSEEEDDEDLDKDVFSPLSKPGKQQTQRNILSGDKRGAERKPPSVSYTNKSMTARSIPKSVPSASSVLQHSHIHSITKQGTESPLRSFAEWLAEIHIPLKVALVIGIVLVTLVKWMIGLGGYSGANKPPMRGDLEAQREWIALTSSILPKSSNFFFWPQNGFALQVPLRRWYFHDLSYWGLDYPPLTCLHSFIIGLIAKLNPTTAEITIVHPDSCGKECSRKWEAALSLLESGNVMKPFLRWSVQVSDWLVYVPAVLLFCMRNYTLPEFAAGDAPLTGKRRLRYEKLSLSAAFVPLLSILLQPALLLVDHGHFQYNSVMLGLTLWTINALQQGYDVLACVLFVAALSFKQMALYYSPIFFAYLLGKCLYLKGNPGLVLFAKLAAATTISFVVFFLPFFTPHLLPQVLRRLFPFERGLFEDKVANVWCSLNSLIKIRSLASNASLAKLSLVVTLVAIHPPVIANLYVSYIKPRLPNAPTSPVLSILPHSLFVSAMAFFLFSYQVHEKSILLPLMPLTLLMGSREIAIGRKDWEWAVLINNAASFSLFPLLVKDNLVLQYFIVVFLWNYLIGYRPWTLSPSFVKTVSLTFYAVALVFHLAHALISPPARLPDIFPVVNGLISSGIFSFGYLWATKRVFQETWASVGIDSKPSIPKSATKAQTNTRLKRA